MRGVLHKHSNKGISDTSSIILMGKLCDLKLPGWKSLKGRFREVGKPVALG
jgi:hypothetical protein